METKLPCVCPENFSNFCTICYIFPGGLKCAYKRITITLVGGFTTRNEIMAMSLEFALEHMEIAMKEREDTKNGSD